MEGKWGTAEYSHGYMIPLVAAFLVWQRRVELLSIQWHGSYAGALLLALALFTFLLGELSTLYTVVQYAFWLSLVAISLALLGFRGLRIILVPLVYLLFMIPLPNFLYNNLSQELQLISSQIGVWVIRLFDISVFLEGNVIDLGVYKLQVVDACSGLRYLFPLMSFGFLIAYLYKGPLWQRAFLFLSTIPLTILMNSFRIGVIGVLVEHWGIGMADGFLHYFEGWIVFMACLGLLFLEIVIFHYLSKSKESLWSRFEFDTPQPERSETYTSNFTVKKPLLLCLLILLVTAPSTMLLDKRQEHLPERELLSQFPLALGAYSGREGYIEAEIVDTLKVTDYLIADYRKLPEASAVNFYVAYYDSQRKGASIHSPRSCIPGGGWEIAGMEQREIETLTTSNGRLLKVNRVVIKKGNVEQIVYYWFQQRGRVITNEYLAKWYIFWDALTKNRTDGALVRVVVPVYDGQEQSVADAKIVDFIEESYPLLNRFVPS